MKIGFYTLLFIVFLILKLIGIITWSWWLITAPLWIPFVFISILLLIIPLFLKGDGGKYWDNLDLILDKWTKEIKINNLMEIDSGF